MPTSPRAQRRALARADAKLARDRERLATLEAGGSAARPIFVETASVIEPHASSMPCLHCETPYRVDDHMAETIDGAAVRLVHARCPFCDARRVLYFAIRPRALN